MKELKPCKHGHTGIRDSRGRCVECHRIEKRKYNHSPAGKKARAKGNANTLAKEAAAAGVDGDIRREIENRRLDRELEALLNA